MGQALDSFRENISPDPDLVAVDAVLSVLYGLIVAAQRETIPPWVRGEIESMQSPQFSLALAHSKALL